MDNRPGFENLPASRQRQLKHLKFEPKLNWDIVNEIRMIYAYHSRTHGVAKLAEKYGVSPTTIYKVIRGQTWKVTEGDGNVPVPKRQGKDWRTFRELLMMREQAKNMAGEMREIFTITAEEALVDFFRQEEEQEWEAVKIARDYF